MTDDTRTPTTQAGRDLLLDHQDLPTGEYNRLHDAILDTEKQARDATGLREWQHAVAGCRCPERPNCLPHGSDGVHQWLDLCDLPHEHTDSPADRTVAAFRQRDRAALAVAPQADDVASVSTTGRDWEGQPTALLRGRCETCFQPCEFPGRERDGRWHHDDIARESHVIRSVRAALAAPPPEQCPIHSNPHRPGECDAPPEPRLPTRDECPVCGDSMRITTRCHVALREGGGK